MRQQKICYRELMMKSNISNSFMRWGQELLLAKWSFAYLEGEINEGKELTFECHMLNTLQTFYIN